MAVRLSGSRENVTELLHGLDIFVLPSLNEGISNTILEAMASGLPVVATDVGGNSEIVINGQTGILVPEDDPEAVAKALLTYVDDREMAKTHGRAGRARMKKSFGLSTMIDRYAAVYESL